MTPDLIEKRWRGTAIVAASGPSLTHDVADACRGHKVIAVNDAWRMLRWADVLYAADYQWYNAHNGCAEFSGEKWLVRTDQSNNTRVEVAKKFGLRLVLGRSADTFSFDPAFIHLGILGTGANSGFQAINLALLFGATRIVLVGFDMRKIDGRAHFFGDHPKQLNKRQNFAGWIRNFAAAAQSVPEGIEIINCTPDSALTCFPQRDLREVLDGSEAHRAA